MLLEEADRIAFKDWAIPRLEKISDADAAVLADYVIALVGVADEAEEVVRQNSLDALIDFLQEHTATFIDEVLKAIKTRSFLPKNGAQAAAPQAPTLLPSPALSAEAPPFNPPTGPSNLSSQWPRGPGPDKSPPMNSRGEQQRKRRYNERESGQSTGLQDPHYTRASTAERPLKQVARTKARNSRMAPGATDSNPGMPSYGGPAAMPPIPMPSFPGLPTPPAGFPLAPVDPMSLFTMMGMFAGIPNATTPSMNQPTLPGQRRAGLGRCRDYDTKGYCALGSTCPYEHGGEIVLPPSADEYDPTRASLDLTIANKAQGGTQSRRQHNSSATGGRATRAPFSQLGPSFDLSNSTVVVEQIPEENFTEDEVRGFFSQFGDIAEVSMQAYKRLAIVKFHDHSAARRAYESPQPVFNNRFVKVYWYKIDSSPTPAARPNGLIPDHQRAAAPTPAERDQEALYAAEIEKRQADAQRAFEERQRKSREADARTEEVERRLEEIQEEMRTLREQLLQRTKMDSEGGDGQGSSALNDATLLDQLSTLQAEAQGLNSGHDTSLTRGGARGRGYRSRGTYPPRGRGSVHSRGVYRGRGYWASTFGGGRSGVKRLDNRPRRIAVSGIETGSEKDEALRQHLLNHYECDSINPDPDRTNTLIITFKERYMAEMFIDHSSNIPEVGKLELAWVPNSVKDVQAQPMVADALPSDGDVKMEEANGDEPTTGTAQPNGEDTNGEEINGNNATSGDADYDVADDEDRWMAA